MRRRELFKAAAVGALAIAAPRIVRAEKINKLVFVPTSDLAILDPVVTGARPTRNHAYLVFDTLYGIDTNWTAQPQMVDGHQVEEDGLTWTDTRVFIKPNGGRFEGSLRSIRLWTAGQAGGGGGEPANKTSPGNHDRA